MAVHKKLSVSYKVFFGLLGLSAVITEVAVLVGRGTFIPANFFSFFTIQSNIIAVVVLLAGALLLIKKKQSKLLDMLRGAAVLYMAVTGIIFALLLSGLDVGTLTAVPWDNTVLHYIMPIAVFIDWLLDAPKRRIPFTRALWWLLYPVAYLLYTLVRGHFANWYPYPFLDVGDKGYAVVLTTSLFVAAVVTGLAMAVAKVSRHRI